MKRLEEYLIGKNAPDAAEKSRIMLAFMALVLEKNESINLTSIKEPELFIEKHLIDSSACYGWPEIEEAEIIADMGTGAGFPGVPLAILYPEKDFTLIDSLGKRTEFLKEALPEIGIKNIRLIKSRAEDAGRDEVLREKFDLCLSRAVGNLSVLSEYCLPLIKPGAFFYAWKTEGAASEIEESLQARLLLGAGPEVIVRPFIKYDKTKHDKTDTEDSNINANELTESIDATKSTDQVREAISTESTESELSAGKNIYQHNMIIIQKERHTPDTYPRRAGVPSRIPL